MNFCKYCYRPITQEVLDEKRKRKILNALASTEKRIANGTKCGPRTKIDWNKALRLRQKYFSKARIAKFLGVSRSYVSREFIKRGWK